ncbi:MAG: hypothetical protein V2I36_06060 [Desulfopila sp.]|jgi:aspartokinase|nr:hypothetical protein [Desulfopila sp.]
MIDTVRIGGIKLSGELVQIDFLESDGQERLTSLLRDITTAKISIPHLHQGLDGSATQTTLCLAADDFSLLESGIRQKTEGGWRRFLPSVGTISIFPHGYDMGLFARVSKALANRGIPVCGMSSSVSAIVYHTDFSLLDRAVEAVLTVCELPLHHTPHRPVVVLGGEVVETIAVYWEPKVRIYGMDIQRELTLFRLACHEILFQSSGWEELCRTQSKFRLLNSRIGPQDEIYCGFVVDKNTKERFLEELSRLSQTEQLAQPVALNNVEMISFYGPHFQDRYGIADLVFSTLRENGFSLLISGCTGTSVHLVVPGNQADSVAEFLKNIIAVP